MLARLRHVLLCSHVQQLRLSHAIEEGAHELAMEWEVHRDTGRRPTWLGYLALAAVQEIWWRCTRLVRVAMCEYLGHQYQADSSDSEYGPMVYCPRCGMAHGRL